MEYKENLADPEEEIQYVVIQSESYISNVFCEPGLTYYEGRPFQAIITISCRWLIQHPRILLSFSRGCWDIGKFMERNFNIKFTNPGPSEVIIPPGLSEELLSEYLLGIFRKNNLLISIPDIDSPLQFSTTDRGILRILSDYYPEILPPEHLENKVLWS